MIRDLLIIDDDPSSLYVLKMMVNKGRFADNVITLRNGKEAIEYFERLAAGEEQVAPELVFSDINMPVMNGLEFVAEYSRRFAHLFPAIKICIVSALIDSDERARALNYSSVIDVSQKPILLQDLDRLRGLEGIRKYFIGDA
ncbi:response regulator transcription factor [Telluribacter sp. SYSU D00476]|uniref:response regulator transcription factor n=1 Tax=Telluribacter sp. SYSU D00476 TaxID=2811430 RepID=UPI001FF510A2|nr:response regulator [Telluribacter sp. SYSU D00476]